MDDLEINNGWELLIVKARDDHADLRVQQDIESCDISLSRHEATALRDWLDVWLKKPGS